ncbi:MAG TPA: hypothetical protein VJS43_16160 [Candidatus Acidoferrales bacterium]|nr:hypothetical protein [Candidatus Acidoferrales bacterium]
MSRRPKPDPRVLWLPGFEPDAPPEPTPPIFTGRSGPILIDLTSQRFRKLVVIARAGRQGRYATSIAC